MKKKEKYYPVNNQEDEDGYTFYPDTDIHYKNITGEQNAGFYDSNINSEPQSEKHPFHALVIQMH